MQIFDAHLHIIDAAHPLVPNNGFLPDGFTCRNYLDRMAGQALAGGAVVSGSFQGFDQGYLLGALRELWPGFVGVTQLPATVTDDEIMDLDGAGVRGIRFNLRRGGSEDVRHLREMARRIHDLAGWHVELYADSRDLDGLLPTLTALPRVSIDHLGLSAAGFGTLLRLAGAGVGVKATGFGRVDFDVPSALAKVWSVNPDALMFGTDLPCTRAARPYRDEDLALVIETLGESAAGKVLHDNAARFYRSSLNTRTATSRSGR